MQLVRLAPDWISYPWGNRDDIPARPPARSVLPLPADARALSHSLNFRWFLSYGTFIVYIYIWVFFGVKILGLRMDLGLSFTKTLWWSWYRRLIRENSWYILHIISDTKLSFFGYRVPFYGYLDPFFGHRVPFFRYRAPFFGYLDPFSGYRVPFFGY